MTTQIQINSKDRATLVDNGSSTPSNFSVTYEDAISGIWELSYALINNSPYNINTTNNTVKFTDSAAHTFTVPVGWYTPASLATALQTGFNSVSTGYTVTINNGFVTIATTGPNFTINFTTSGYAYSSLGTILGFGNIITPSGATVTATSPINVSWNICWRISITDTPQGLKFPNNVQANFTIGITAALQANQEYTPRNRKQHINFGEGMQTLTIKVFDDSGTLVDFNNQNWIMILQRVR